MSKIQSSKQHTKSQITQGDEQNQDSILDTWQEIQHIKSDNKQLRDEIDTDKRMQGLTKVIWETKMENIQEQSSNYAKKIEIETKKQRDLHELIQLTQQQLETYNQDPKKMTTTASESNLPQILSKLKLEENKLEQIRSRHNSALAQINMLKEEINMARRERVIFSGVFKKLESDIKKKDEEFKIFLIRRMEVDQQKKIEEENFKKIKSSAAKDNKKFQKEYEKAISLAEYDDRIIEESGYQGQYITESMQHDTEDNEKSQIQKPEQKLKHSSSAAILKNVQQVEYYEHMFDKLKLETGYDNIDELLDLWVNIEKVNSDLHAEANKKIDKSDDLRKQIEDIDREVIQYRRESFQNEKEEETQESETQILKKKVKAQSSDNDKIKNDLVCMNEKLAKIGEVIGIPKTSSNESADAGIDIKYLRQIEEKIDHVLNMHNYQMNMIVDVDRNMPSEHTQTSAHSKRQNEDNQIIDLLDNVKRNHERNKEAERIMTINDFKREGQNEMVQFNERSKNYKYTAKSSKGKGTNNY